MAYYLKTIQDRRGNHILPRTVATGVFMKDSFTVEVRINQLLKESTDRLDQIKNLASTVEKNKTETDKKITELTNTVNKNKTDIDTKVKNLSTTVTNLSNTVSSNNTELSKKVTNLQTSFNTLNTTVTNNKKDADTKITNLTTTVTNNKKDADTKITNLQTSVTNINKSVTTLNTTVTGQTPKTVSLTFTSSGWVESDNAGYKYMQKQANTNFTSGMVSPVATLNLGSATTKDAVEKLSSAGSKISRMVTYDKGVKAYIYGDEKPDRNLVYIFRI